MDEDEYAELYDQLLLEPPKKDIVLLMPPGVFRGGLGFDNSINDACFDEAS